MAFELLCGRPPFADRRSDAALLHAHLEADPPASHAARPELQEALAPVFAAGLAKDPPPDPGSRLPAGAADAAGTPVSRAPSATPQVQIALTRMPHSLGLHALAHHHLRVEPGRSHLGTSCAVRPL